MATALLMLRGFPLDQVPQDMDKNWKEVRVCHVILNMSRAQVGIIGLTRGRLVGK